jgi:hypothetical protein
MPYASVRRWVRLVTISCTRAFMGATYTILNWLPSTVPSDRTYCPRVCRMVSMAQLVFPAPVGAHSSKFSLLLSAASYTRLCTRFRVFMPLNAGWAQEGRSEIFTSFSLAPMGLGFRAGTCT